MEGGRSNLSPRTGARRRSRKERRGVSPACHSKGGEVQKEKELREKNLGEEAKRGVENRA